MFLRLIWPTIPHPLPEHEDCIRQLSLCWTVQEMTSNLNHCDLLLLPSHCREKEKNSNTWDSKSTYIPPPKTTLKIKSPIEIMALQCLTHHFQPIFFNLNLPQKSPSHPAIHSILRWPSSTRVSWWETSPAAPWVCASVAGRRCSPPISAPWSWGWAKLPMKFPYSVAHPTW